MNGTVFDIQKFSLHDGPGIRTTVFMKGCPLRCVWCHNPESRAKNHEIFFYPEKCIGCGACLAACRAGQHTLQAGRHEFARAGCRSCGACAAHCYAGALSVAGREMSADEVLAEVEKDMPFYKASGGGLTLSGGEPLFQPAFALELTRLAKQKGISVAIETSGFGDTAALLAIAENTDLFLFDYKAPARLYSEYTGVAADKILFNLCQLDKTGRKIVLRCPMIPGINLCPEFYAEIAELANAHRQIVEINLEPYHPLGVSKNTALGKKNAYAKGDFLDKAELTQAEEFIQKKTNIPVTIL